MWPGIVIELVLAALCQFLDICLDSGLCPPEGCEKLKNARAKATAARQAVVLPGTRSIGDFFRCLDWRKAVDAISELVDVIVDAINGCPGEEPPVSVPESPEE